MGTSNAKEVEHGALRLENRPTANGADFDRWHRHADLEIAIVAESGLARIEETGKGIILLPHHRNAIAALDVLSRVLSGGQENRGDDVRSVCIEAAYASSHGASDQVFACVEFN